MQQEASKKNKKLIWLIVGLAALLLVVGAVLAILLIPGQQAGEETGPVGGRPELYWNVDRDLYLGNAESAGLSTREPGEDGLYHLRFAYEGEVVEYTVADKRLVNVIDNLDVVGLVFDGDGNVIDAVNPNTVATEVAKDFFVQKNVNGSLMLNSSIVMNGMEMPVQLGELTRIYNVVDGAENPGQIDEAELMDKVLIYANDLGEVTHVYIIERQPTGIIGWRVDKRQWDSTTQHSTRQPDENGVWHITVAVDGEHKVFKCKDQAIVDNIDKRATLAADVALQLDEEGYIIGVLEPNIALRGKLSGANYHVTELNGDQFTATYQFSGKENGKKFSGTLTENTKIYDVSYGGTGAYIGEPTELQMTDRIICYTDLEGNPLLIFVTYRMVDVPVAYNRVRMYDSTKQETTRTPNANGYYVFEVAIDGKVRTVRTKDKELASKIDSYSYQIVGLKLEGDIVVAVYDPHYVSGDNTYGAGGRRFVVDLTGVILSWVTVGYDFASPTNLVMRPDVQIYDVTGYPGTKFGAETELQLGDMIRPLVDYNSNITHLYVVSRYSGEPVYYNLSRKYDETKAESTRVPDEEGYYVFDMASQGKRVTVKTKSKEIADFMDMQYAPVMSLKVDKNGIVKGAYPADAAYKYGYKTANWNWFVGYNEDGTIATTSYSGLTDNTYKLSDDVKIYNVSAIIDDHKGEPTSKLMPGDLIQAVAVNDTKEIVEIYVITRKVESKLYYNISRKYNTVTKQTTREPDAEGYYVFDLLVDGKIKQFKTKEKDIATSVDALGYVGFGMRVSGDIIKQAFSASSIKGISTTVSNYDVTKVGGGEMTLTRYIPSATNVGEKKTYPLASNSKIYNVSAYAEDFGAKVKPGLGDRGVFYVNDDGEIEWGYIWYKNTHEKGHISYCEHCDKNVYWQPYAGVSYTKDAHVYVTHEGQTVGQVNISDKETKLEDRPELVIDLNGKTLKARGRAFLVYGTLSIVDTVGGGKLVGGNTATDSAQALMSSSGGVINLYSGTLTQNPENKAVNSGGVVFVGADSTFNMYGGTVEGGYAISKGGNVYNAYGTFNMYGGKITGGVNGAGLNLYVGAATFNMEGGTIDGDIVIDSKDAKVSIGGSAVINKGAAAGLQLISGVKLPLDKVTSDTKVVVDAAGVFTEEASNIQSYLANFSSSDPEMPVVVEGKALAGGKHLFCEHCDDYAYFGKFSAGACSGSSHLVLTEDVTLSRQIQIGSTSDASDDVVIDLNGHTITAEGTGEGASTGRFSLLYSTLSIQDSTGGGKIQSTQEGCSQGGTVMIGSTGELNLYSGEISLAEGASARRRGGVISVGAGTFNMYGGKVSGGQISDNPTSDSMYNQGGNLYLAAGGAFNMYGGELVGGGRHESSQKYLLGGNIGASTGSTVNIYGGTVTGGYAEIGGNIYTGGELNLLGGEVVDGEAVNTLITNFDGTTGVTTYSASNGVGGNLYIDAGAETVIGGGETTAKVSGGVARYGGNIYIEDTANEVVIGNNGVVANGKTAPAFEGDEKYNGGNVYMLEGTKLTVQGTVTGGEAWQGGNVALGGGAVLTVDGGTVSDGTIDGWNGGNIQSNNGTVKLQNGAAVRNGKALRYRGGNIYAGGGTELYISDSTVSGGEAWQGGNIFISGRVYTSGEETKYDYGILEIGDGAVVTGGVTNITDNYNGGGNICALAATVTVGDATIEKGVAKTCGGNIFATYYSEDYADFKTTITLGEDAKVLDGESLSNTVYNGGGNIYAMGGTTIECAGTVAGGESGRYGGNLMVNRASLTLLDGAVVEDGEASVSGGNICKFNYGTVDVQAGASVLGGTAEASAGSIFISGDDGDGILNIAGTVTGGEVLIYNSKVDMTVSGDAKIDDLKIDPGVKIILGELTENADITVEAADIFTEPSEKANEYKDYFHPYDEQMGIDVVDGALRIGIKKYCAHCEQEVVFGPFVEGAISKSAHMVVTEDTLIDAQLTIGSATNKDIEVVVDLNGHSVTGDPDSENNYKRFALVYGKLFIQDSVGGGKVVGHPTTENAGAIMLGSTGEFTLYSGEIAIAENTAAAKSGGVVSVGSGKFTMNGGKISGGLVKDHVSNLEYDANMGGTVYVSYGSFTMNGGEIVGGSADASAAKPLYGGAIYNANGTVTINGGTVTGGKAALGGSIYTASTLNILGGTVSGGEAVAVVDGTTVSYGLGGSIYVAENAKVTVGKADGDVKATVSGGKAYRGGNIYIADIENTVTVEVNGIVSDGTAAAPVEGNELYNGGNVYAVGGAKLTVKGTVSGGHAWQGGNVTLSGGAALTVDGGTVSNGTIDGWNGGNIQSNNGTVRLQNKAQVLNGKALRYRGGNIYSAGGGELYISDSTVSGGKAYQGGNIYAATRVDATNTQTGFDVGYVEISDGAVVTGGETTYATASPANGGGNICSEGANIVISGATVENGVSKGAGGNILLIPFVSGDKTYVPSLTLNEGASVTGGEATYHGGNIYANNGCTVTVTGATVSGGQAAAGGNIYLSGKSGATSVDTGYSVLNASRNAKISGGKATTGGTYSGGGNIYAIRAEVTVTDSKIEDGVAAQCGGNILVTEANLTLSGSTVVEDGTATANLGGNICKFAAGKVDIQAGVTVQNGTAGNNKGADIWFSGESGKIGQMTVSGTVTGEIKVGSYVELTVSGAPKLAALELNSGVKIILGELTADTEICVSASGVFTVANDKAAEYLAAGYFTAADTTKKVDAVDNTLTVIAK